MRSIRRFSGRDYPYRRKFRYVGMGRRNSEVKYCNCSGRLSSGSGRKQRRIRYVGRGDFRKRYNPAKFRDNPGNFKPLSTKKARSYLDSWAKPRTSRLPDSWARPVRTSRLSGSRSAVVSPRSRPSKRRQTTYFTDALQPQLPPSSSSQRRRGYDPMFGDIQYEGNPHRRNPGGYRRNPDPDGKPWGPQLYNPLTDNNRKYKNEGHYKRMISKLRRNPW